MGDQSVASFARDNGEKLEGKQKRALEMREESLRRGINSIAMLRRSVSLKARFFFSFY